jgi:hypothetical protein
VNKNLNKQFQKINIMKKSFLVGSVAVISILFIISYAKALLPNGAPCIMDAECESGYCGYGPGQAHVCIANPCNDGYCDLTVDCFRCSEIGGYKGDCRIAECGFATERCNDKICDVNVDCFCVNQGDCGYLPCLFVNWKHLLVPVVLTVVGVAIIILIIRKVKKK